MTSELVSTPVVSDGNKEIFLDRFVKEVIKPFRFPKENGGAGFAMVNGQLKKRTHPKKEKAETMNGNAWNRRIIMGTNQCLRYLDRCMKEGAPRPPRPGLIVLARDIYPPTMLAHVPVISKRLRIPLVLLAGKASNELGQAVGIRKVSIIVFLDFGGNGVGSSDDSKVDSFIHFVQSNIIPKT